MLRTLVKGSRIGMKVLRRYPRHNVRVTTPPWRSGISQTVGCGAFLDFAKALNPIMEICDIASRGSSSQRERNFHQGPGLGL